MKNQGERDSMENTAKRLDEFLHGPPIPEKLNAFSGQIIAAAIEVHRHLGPGLLESLYEQALMHEMGLRDMQFQSQVPITIEYKGLKMTGQRLDLLVEDGIIVELKSVEFVHPAHKAQLLSYLKSTGHRLGLLINFNTPLLKDGVTRIAN